MQIKNKLLLILLLLFFINIFHRDIIKNKLIKIKTYEGEKCGGTNSYKFLYIKNDYTFLLQSEDRKNILTGKVNNDFFRHNKIMFSGKTFIIKATFGGKSLLIQSVSPKSNLINNKLCGIYY